MSSYLTAHIICPHCSNKGDFTIWQEVNTALNPEMADKVRDLSLFEWKCPKCGKTLSIQYPFQYHDGKRRFTVLPEGATGKETGVDRYHQTRTPEAFAEKSRELKGKPDERTAAIRKQLADLKDKDEQGRQPLPEGIKEELLQRQEKAKKEKGHAPELSKNRRSHLLSKHLKGRSGSTRKPKTSALLDNKLSQMSQLYDMALMLSGKGFAQ